MDSKGTAKCCLCKADIPTNTFFMNLPAEYHAKYALLQIKIADDEQIIKCSTCSWFYVNFGPKPPFVNCQGECKRASCFVCHKSVKIRPETEEEEQELSSHFAHNDPVLSLYYKKWMEAFDCCRTTCPNSNCEITGIKDDACTHMTCDGCRTQYCYFCGLSVDACDKATDEELAASNSTNMTPIYRHNVNWRNNAKRCPMYLVAIADKDDTWPETDQECCEHLSSLKAKLALRQVYEEMGDAVFQQLASAFVPVATTLHSFPLDSIKSAKPVTEWIDRGDDGEDNDQDSSDDY
eukprot:g763.t1